VPPTALTTSAGAAQGCSAAETYAIIAVGNIEDQEAEAGHDAVGPVRVGILDNLLQVRLEKCQRLKEARPHPHSHPVQKRVIVKVSQVARRKVQMRHKN
jgi:hypothetical protein